ARPDATLRVFQLRHPDDGRLRRHFADRADRPLAGDAGGRARPAVSRRLAGAVGLDGALLPPAAFRERAGEARPRSAGARSRPPAARRPIVAATFKSPWRAELARLSFTTKTPRHKDRRLASGDSPLCLGVLVVNFCSD